MALLSEAEIEDKLRTLLGWSRAGAEIAKQFTFNSFMPAIDFVNRVAQAAERAGHHPYITVNYNRVKLALSTHSEGGITKKDINLASEINLLQDAVTIGRL